MPKQKHIYYFVEGDSEKKLVKALQRDPRILPPGRCEVLNVVQNRFSHARILGLPKHAIVVLIFDTDAGSSITLDKNIAILKKHVRAVFCIPQVDNLEDEIVRSCSLQCVRDFVGSTSRSNFKRDFLNLRDLRTKLEQHGFSSQLFWTQEPNCNGEFKHILNECSEVRLDLKK